MTRFQPCISGASVSPRVLPCCAGLSSQNQKLRDRVAALLNEARYKESVNTSLKEEISRMIPMTGAAHKLQAPPTSLWLFWPACCLLVAFLAKWSRWLV